MKKIIYILIPTLGLIGCASSSYDQFAYSSTDSMPPLKTPSNFDKPLNDSGYSYQDDTVTTYTSVPNAIFFNDLTTNPIDIKNANKLIDYNTTFLQSHEYSHIKLISYSNPMATTKKAKKADLKLQIDRINYLKKLLTDNGVKYEQIEIQKNQTAQGDFQRVDIVYPKQDNDNILGGYKFISNGVSPLLVREKKTVTIQESPNE